MALSLPDCTFFGPALPEPFVRFQLEERLRKEKLLRAATGAEGLAVQEQWEVVRKKLRDLGGVGGARRVAQHVLEPLASPLGYERLECAESVATREGEEEGGFLLVADGAGPHLRAWAHPAGTDLDAPGRRGRAYRFSPSRVAARVLAARGERVALLTDGVELRLLVCDPARPDSHVAIALDRTGGWRGARAAPDSFRLLLALASPAGVALVPELVEDARLAQTTVTRKLRRQARLAVETFVQELIDHPANEHRRGEWAEDPSAAARAFWNEGLILVYRLLFVFKLESASDPARAFSFASTALWRGSYSPSTALAPVARAVLDRGAETGSFLEESLRTLFRLFLEGLTSSELRVTPLGGMLFGAGAMPRLDSLAWGERAVASLLDHLLWTPSDGRAERERVHYGTLDVEDLGRVYESLLELEPGIATEPMCRLKRAKLEVVVPARQGTRYQRAAAPVDDSGEEEDEDDGDSSPRTKVEWIEAIPAGRFYLRVGLGRKASGSYYTPHPFVRFLVQETLGPQLAEKSPAEEPDPGAILALKVLDPAMGSGHFLVEACRYLGDALYEACRLCDELALAAETEAEKAEGAECERHLARAAEFRARVERLPDPDDELLAYLPSRASEGEASGYSQAKALALCRRLVAVHSLYGVDKNPLAVELAKLALWLESYAEGLPLTFLNHRLVLGDSLTGPFAEHLAAWPRSGAPMDDLFAQGLGQRLSSALAEALEEVAGLEASVGTDLADLEHKRAAKERLDRALAPSRTLAAAWSGGVMLGEEADDAAYERLARAVAEGSALEPVLEGEVQRGSSLARMLETGRACLAYDLAFPEVFHPGGSPERSGGFDVVLGNPPWDAIQFKSKEFLAAFDLDVFEALTKHERSAVQERLLADPGIGSLYEEHSESFERLKRCNDRLYQYQKVTVEGDLAGRQLDTFRVFMERNAELLGASAFTGVVVPSAFHANAGATGVRKLYLEEMDLRSCYSFENRRKLFDIDSRFKFAAVVARRSPGATRSFRCAFYLHELDWLFSGAEPLIYTLDFVRKTGGEYLTFLELRSPRDAEVARVLYAAPETFGEHCERVGIRFARECDMSNDSWRFTPTGELVNPGEDPRDPAVAARLRERGYLPLHEGKTFHQYDDRWGDRPRYCVALEKLVDKPAWAAAARHYRLAFRNIATSTNERTSIFGLHPPGCATGEKGPAERTPDQRNLGPALLLMAIGNSFSFDFGLRVRVAATVNFFILNGCPIPEVPQTTFIFLAHAALRLTCNHNSYEPLWRSVLGDVWRESGPPFTFPAFPAGEGRDLLRAAIDAAVARAYGIDRAQYEHVLTSFSHTSAPDAPRLCLAAFDELQRQGLEAFCRRYDPYFDVSLPDTLPEPVLDLRLPGTAEPVPGSRDRSGQTSFVPPDFGPLFDRPRRVAETAPARAGSGLEPPWAAKTPTDRQLLILCRAVEAHRQAGRLATLGNVKAEKICHLVEARTGIDLGRSPVREAAGPADFPQQKRVIHRAARLHAFRVDERPGGGGAWSPDSGLGKRLREFEQSFAVERDEIYRILGLLVPMDTDQSEVVATLFASWNDLLSTGHEPGDEAIVEAFYGWSEGKARFDRQCLTKALAWMREHDLMPTGKAKLTPAERSGGKPKRPRGRAPDAEAAHAALARLLDDRMVLTSREAQAALGISASELRPLFKRLVEEGRAIQEGQRRGTRYRAAPRK